MNPLPDLVCPAGSLPALKAAVDNGADAVYLGFKNDTNARNFAGLNFDAKTMADGIRYAHAKGREVLLAINTFPQAGRTGDWHKAVDAAVDLGVDAIILADIGLLDYAAQASATAPASLRSGLGNQLRSHQFLPARIRHPPGRLAAGADAGTGRTRDQPDTVEIEVFGFGSLCVMNEGRCWLSSYACGESPNTVGRVLAGQVREVGQAAGRHGNPPQRHPHRPLRR